MLKLKLQYYGHLMQRADSFEKTLILERLRAGRKRDDGGWAGWMASPTQWIWVWVDSRSWWWTGRPQFSSVQSLSHVRLFATPWTTAHQASLSIINSQSLFILMSTESVMPFNHLILCHPLLLLLQSFPASGPFPVSQFFASGGHSIGVSASASVLPMNIQDWFPLGLTGLISLQSKGLSSIFSNTTVQKHQFFSAQLSL